MESTPATSPPTAPTPPTTASTPFTDRADFLRAKNAAGYSPHSKQAAEFRARLTVTDLDTINQWGNAS